MFTWDPRFIISFLLIEKITNLKLFLSFTGKSVGELKLSKKKKFIYHCKCIIIFLRLIF